MNNRRLHLRKFWFSGSVFLVWFLMQLIVLVAGAQNLTQIRQDIKYLSSDYFCGRGYEHQGDLKAARWIAGEFENSGLEKFNNSWFQDFKFSINTIRKNVELTVDGRKLNPGTEYILRKSCNTTHQTFNVLFVSDSSYTDSLFARSLAGADISSMIPVINIDYVYANYITQKASFEQFFRNPFPAFIYVTEHPLRSYAIYGLKVKDPLIIEMAPGIINGDARTISINIDTKYEENYTSRNVAGFLKGKSKPDEYVILGAHYDHLGMMGKHTYFPGADDNASGVSTVMEFARFFSEPENRPDCSVIFVCFGAEEAGLIGSTYFVENCPVDLEKIRAVINLDMVAFGQNGFRIENGDVLQEFMNTMNQIIEHEKLDLKLYAAEAQAHSDHYPFIEAGIPAIFITSGVEDSKDYHTVFDTYDSLPFTKTKEICILLREFVYGF